MQQLHKLILHPLTGKIFLCLLAGAYLVYLITFGPFVYTWVSSLTGTVVEYPVAASPGDVARHWTAASMRHATDADQLIGSASDLTQESVDASAGKAAQAAQQQGQPPRNANLSFPLSTVGKVFFTSSAGQDMVIAVVI